MTLFASRRLLVAAAVGALVLPVGVGASQTQPFAWWRSPELGLSPDQRSQIERIFETTRPELLQEWEELDREEAKLSRLINTDADEAVIIRQITRVETARASVNQTRSLMLVRMRKVLTAEQRDILRGMEERREAARRGGGGPSGAKPQGSSPRPAPRR